MKQNGARILLAEDSRFLRKATELILTKAGYEVLTAADGDEALTLARIVAPDLIILDIMMPKRDGLDVLRILKRESVTRHIPVVVLSRLSQKNEYQASLAGAAAFYEKTKLVPESLIDIVQTALTTAKDPELSIRRAPEVVNQNTKCDEFTLSTPMHLSSIDAEIMGSDYENELLDQVVVLNNELIATQRALAAANEELDKIAHTDHLTGLGNRRKANHEIEKLMALARRQDAPLCVALLDLDHFKQINDKYGHTMGDRVLQRFGQVLGTVFRAEDAVGRWGGEEFIVALYGCSIADGVRRLEHLKERFSRERFLNGGEFIHVTFSAGIAAFPEDADSFEMLYQAADRALYGAKEQGRNSIAATSRMGVCSAGLY